MAIPGLDERSVYLSSGTWSLMGIEVPEPIINAKMLELNFTNEGGVDGTIRLLKNISGLWLLQKRRQWEREGHTFTWEGRCWPRHRRRRPSQHHQFRRPRFQHAAGYGRRIRLSAAQPARSRRRQGSRALLPGEPGAALPLGGGGAEEILTSAGRTGGRHLDTIRAVGGSQNRLLNQFTADACRAHRGHRPRPRRRPWVIMMQAVATGHLSSVADGRAAIAASIRQEVRAAAALGWDEAYARFLRVIDEGG